MSSRGERTRAAMLDAGLERIQHSDLNDLLAFLRPEDIAAAVGRSKSTFFHHWPTLRAYIGELSAMVAAPDQPAPPGSALARFMAMTTDPADPSWVSSVRQACMSSFDALLDDPRLPLFLLVPAIGQGPTRDSLRERYQAVDDAISQVLLEQFRAQDRKIREPFSPEAVAVTIHALALGLAIRARVDPDGSTAVLFADVVTALLPALLTGGPTGDLPLDEFIDETLLSPLARGGDPKAVTFVPSPADERLETALMATAHLRQEVVPALEERLTLAVAEPDVEPAAVTRGHLLHLHELASQHQTACLATLGAVTAGLLAEGSAVVPDPLAESGLDAVTLRVLAVFEHICASDRAALARSANVAVMRSAVGLDALPVEDYVSMFVGYVSG